MKCSLQISSFFFKQTQKFNFHYKDEEEAEAILWKKVLGPIKEEDTTVEEAIGSGKKSRVKNILGEYLNECL